MIIGHPTRPSVLRFVWRGGRLFRREYNSWLGSKWFRVCRHFCKSLRGLRDKIWLEVWLVDWQQWLSRCLIVLVCWIIGNCASHCCCFPRGQHVFSRLQRRIGKYMILVWQHGHLLTELVADAVDKCWRCQWECWSCLVLCGGYLRKNVCSLAGLSSFPSPFSFVYFHLFIPFSCFLFS